MRNLLLSLMAAFAIGPAFAQVTGTPGINDYTINGLGSGTTSCSPLCFPNGGLTLNLSVSTSPTNLVLLFISFCPCTTCFIGGPSNACLPAIPATACGGSNQSLDLNISAACPIAFSAVIGLNSAGTISYALPIPSFTGPACTNITISTQAVVIDPCGSGLPPAYAGPFVLTQAYSLSF